MADDQARSQDSTATTLAVAKSLKDIGCECYTLATLACTIFSLKEPSESLSDAEREMIEQCGEFLLHTEDFRSAAMRELDWIRRRCS